MAQLTVTTNTATTTADLTANGTTDWEHWTALVGRTQMTSSPNLISDRTDVGTFVEAGYNNDNRTLTASNPSVNDQDGIYSGGVAVTGNGFSFTVPADDTHIRTLKLYFGQFSSDAVLTVSMSGGGVTTPVTVSFPDPGSNIAGDMNATIVFQAASAGQTLTITWLIGPTFSQSYGNVTISGAALSQVAAPATSMGQASAPAFLVVGPGRFRSPMGVGRARPATSGGVVALTATASITFAGTAALIGTDAAAASAPLTVGGTAAPTGTDAPAASAPITFSGTAGLKATDALAATAAALFSGTAAPAGSDALASSAAVAVSGTAGLLATDAPAASAPITFSGTAGLSGADVLAASTPIAFAGTAALLGTDKLLATGAITFDGQAATGGALAATVPITFSATAALAGNCADVATAAISTGGTAAATARGALAASPAITVSGVPTLTAGGAVAAMIPFAFAGSALMTSGQLIARREILFADDKATRPAAREWKRTHDN